MDIRRSSTTSSGNGNGLLGHLSKSTIMSVFVILLLIFLFCSSLYLVFRIDALQRQVSFSYLISSLSKRQRKSPMGGFWRSMGDFLNLLPNFFSYMTSRCETNSVWFSQIFYIRMFTFLKATFFLKFPIFTVLDYP